MQHKLGLLHMPHQVAFNSARELTSDPAETGSDVRGLTMHLSRPHSQPRGASALVGWGGLSGEHYPKTHKHTRKPTHQPKHNHTHIHNTRVLAVLSLTANLLTTKGPPYFIFFLFFSLNDYNHKIEIKKTVIWIFCLSR